MKRLSYLVRILTVTPIMAGALLVILFLDDPDIFSGTRYFVLSLIFLTVLPLLAYPLQPVCPHYKNKGRSGQRSLAMVFATAGYILGCVCGLFFSFTGALWLIYLDYLLCGAAIVGINKFLHWKISAHTCGVVGPSLLLFYFHQPVWGALGLLLTLPVILSSLRMKRHTLPQLLCGALVAGGVLLLLHLLPIA